LKPWFWLPAKLAHDLSPYAIEIYSKIFGKSKTPTWDPLTYKNLIFKNRLGIAGGVDKNADHLAAWESLGCGFLEMGTVTPIAQSPNTGKIIDRDLATQSLWNKMGFPSAGADEALYNLRNFKTHSQTPVFVNIGKNRITENFKAHEDYIFLLERFSEFADAFVINISSPNTAGLRDLAKKENLDLFLNPLMTAVQNLNLTQPILIKLSPDLAPDDMNSVINSCLAHNVDGFVLTNTTLSRSGLKQYPAEGGVSGSPLSELSKQALKIVVTACADQKTKKLIISAGGVMTERDVFERIKMGADLVQVYTALIYNGPGFFRKVAHVAQEREQERKQSY
jgi:dihydroorotate dehydrogenase